MPSLERGAIEVTIMHRDKLIRKIGMLLPLAALPVWVSYAAAEEASVTVDTSKWTCGYCPFEEGFSGEVEAGGGHVSDDSSKFGEYNGLNESGAFLLGNARLRYRDEDADFVDLTARDIGLDSRYLRIEGGRQGKYQLFLEYDQISHALSDSATTPYRGNGGDSLTLPAGWVRSGSTAGMTALPASLRGVDLETERKRLGVGLTLIPRSNWESRVSFRRETREGRKATAGAFLFSSAQLVEPVDYVTDEVDVSLAWSDGKWQAGLAYYGSFFDNDDESLRWQNAYTPVVVGADAGERALPPDNRFHQLLLSGGYQLSDSTRANANIAIGRMEQDEDILPATLNGSLGVPALPRKSLNARVDTVNAHVRLISSLTDRLRLNASFNYNDRDNDTPSDMYGWVTTDAFVAVPRRNLPYSFTQSEFKLDADYRLDMRRKLSVGYEYDRRERTHQEVDETREQTVWGRATVRALKNIDLTFKLGHSDRDGSSYRPVNEIDPPQNPLMRKFNMADRTRNFGRLRAALVALERLSLGLAAEYAADDYDESEIGLLDSRETSFSADASMMVSDKTNLSFFAAVQRTKTRQAGSQTFSTPDWRATNDDRVNSYGIAVSHDILADRLSVGADFTVMRGTGEIDVDSGAPDSSFPDLRTDLDSVRLYADYRLKKNTSLHLGYWYEHYDTDDWAIDNVDPDTTANVLAFGEDLDDYDVHTVTLSLRYRF
jgi:MtrB/PioB family decaheme-associated outer membrane protein